MIIRLIIKFLISIIIKTFVIKIIFINYDFAKRVKFNIGKSFINRERIFKKIIIEEIKDFKNRDNNKIILVIIVKRFIKL